MTQRDSIKFANTPLIYRWHMWCTAGWIPLYAGFGCQDMFGDTQSRLTEKYIVRLVRHIHA